MGVSIRLTRTGARNARAFRLVAADMRSPRDGRFIETLGWYDPARSGETFSIDAARVEYWREHGAVLSDTAANLLKQARQAGSAREAAGAEAPADADGAVETTAAPDDAPQAAVEAVDAADEAGEPEKSEA